MKDFSKLIFLIFSAAFLIYYVPSGVNRVLFFVFIYYFYKSPNDFLWIAFFLILLEQPGGFFSGGEVTDQLRLPLYTLTSKISISFEQLFILTAFIKAMNKKESFLLLSFMKNYYVSCLVLFFFLIIVSFVLGFSFDYARYLYRTIIDVTLFYSIYFLFKNTQDFERFFKLIFPFSFIALVLQLTSVVAGYQLIHFYKSDVSNTQGIVGLDVAGGGTNRPIEIACILLLNFIFSIYFIIKNNKYYNRTYLLTVNIISFLSIVLTATRGWVIAFSIFYLLTALSLSTQFRKNIFKFSIVAIILLVILFSIQVFKDQYSSSLERLSTIELVLGGDVTGGGTVQRYDVRAPNVLSAFQQSTIILGAGFSNLYFEKGDSHVGFHNYLFNTGIVGFLLLIVFLLKLIVYPFKIINKFQCDKSANAVKIFSFLIIALTFLNNSTQFFGFDVGSTRILDLSIILCFYSNQVKEVLNIKTAIEKRGE